MPHPSLFHPSPLTLHCGDATSWGNAALIAAGTGLGMALLLPEQGIRLPMPSEGGHMDFAPRNDEEIGLLQFLQGRFGRHVSIERVVHLPRNSYTMVKPFKWTYAGKPLTS